MDIKEWLESQTDEYYKQNKEETLHMVEMLKIISDYSDDEIITIIENFKVNSSDTEPHSGHIIHIIAFLISEKLDERKRRNDICNVLFLCFFLTAIIISIVSLFIDIFK